MLNESYGYRGRTGWLATTRALFCVPIRRLVPVGRGKEGVVKLRKLAAVLAVLAGVGVLAAAPASAHPAPAGSHVVHSADWWW